MHCPYLTHKPQTELFCTYFYLCFHQHTTQPDMLFLVHVLEVLLSPQEEQEVTCSSSSLRNKSDAITRSWIHGQCNVQHLNNLHHTHSNCLDTLVERQNFTAVRKVLCNNSYHILGIGPRNFCMLANEWALSGS